MLKYTDPMAYQHLKDQEEASKRAAEVARLQDPEYQSMKARVEAAKHAAQLTPEWQQRYAQDEAAKHAFELAKY